MPGSRIRPYTSDFVVPRFSRVAFLALRPFVLPVGNGAGANSGRAVGIASPDIRIVRIAVVSGALPHRRFEIFVIFVRCGPGIEAASGIRGSGRRPAGSRPQRPGGSSPLIACLLSPKFDEDRHVQCQWDSQRDRQRALRLDRRRASRRALPAGNQSPARADSFGSFRAHGLPLPLLFGRQERLQRGGDSDPPRARPRRAGHGATTARAAF